MFRSKEEILWVDRDLESLEPTRLFLEKEGLEVKVVASGEEALEYVRFKTPDIIVLEIALPGMDGVEVCRCLREMPPLDDLIILFVTTRQEAYSQIAAFEAGADDYIPKPVQPRVFHSRLKALLKRREQLEPEAGQDSPSLVIDRERYIAIKDGVVIEWRNKEFNVLSLLSSSPGKVFSRDEILRHVWDNGHTVSGRTIDVYISWIRKKIGSDHIVTVIGQGYKFVD